MTTRDVRGINPATGEALEPAYPVTDPATLEAAVQAAAGAALAYAQTPGDMRAEFLTAAAATLDALGDDIVARAMLETALPEARLRGELTRTTNQLRLFARVAAEGSWVEARIDRPDAARTPPKPDLRSMRVPLGPVVVFGASNFPLAFSVAGGDTASALAAGCPVIVKAHPAHPGTSALAAQAISDAAHRTGLPDGVFGIVYDDGHHAGLTLTEHPLVQAVAFTGSRAGGLALLRAAQARPVPIPVYAEMSSVNPVVFTGAGLDRGGSTLAAALATSISGSGGQLCTQPGLLFVPSGPQGDAFLAEVAAQLDRTPACTLLTSGIHDAYRRGTAGIRSQPGVSASTVQASDHSGAQAQLYSVSARDFTPELEAEVFGPVSLAVRYDDIGEVSALVRGLEGQLTATLHAAPEELSLLSGLLAALQDRAGRVLFGGFPTGVEVGHAVVHGGPFPATTAFAGTSVGTHAITRFTRLLAFQNFPDAVLPPALQDANPLDLLRMVDGEWSRQGVTTGA
ncbi:NADP-dependent aldehyde dehydrogenase [Deinococcus metalli]|uniref:2,5-dioxovalerate dehydrogenase n=1 Tax=Deinococcus metalli TaxID=1141878 RepID=A0A7W8KFG7_9DEIO|nr:aldehyde dehydrogenase (NADP(+)) [Deinococcus metalli]MBB5375554.1 NADP-dependent aldehyde dehydrogenase [Deinococcus metalli]GHF28407.1 2,5-dioxovalerate dehydrogenase [Deinococcus metalli]